MPAPFQKKQMSKDRGGDGTRTTDNNDAFCLHDGADGAGEGSGGIAGLLEKGGRWREGCGGCEGDE